METLAVRDLSFTYPNQTAPALRGLSLTVERGEFLVLCGPSGCGKTTLLRQCKPVMAPHGHRTGEIFFEGVPLESLSHRAQSEGIGFVQQSPENQIVTDQVWHELAFGLESLGYDAPAIRRRVAEVASFFGIQGWFRQSTAQLSGGQKQLLNLASVLVMQPSLLILDEPTSQLDPIAAASFLGVLGRVNRELGTTVLLTEHRLEDALPLATRAAVLDRGELLCADTPARVGEALRDSGHEMFLAMPAPMRVWAAAGGEGSPCPITVREGRDWLEDFAARHPLQPLPEEPIHRRPPVPAVQARELWFRYGQELPDVIRGLSLELHRGEFLALLGGNGAGKSTALALISGQYPPCRGELTVRGRVGVLPQHPKSLFTRQTVREELAELGPDPARAVSLCRLAGLLDRHPYDLSGGEQQRLALAKLLLLQPDILLLDEPTKGLDAGFQRSLGEILENLLREGTAILMVSHDIEFCARHAHRCALLFDGGIPAEGTPRQFFPGNSFYTTSANRMARSAVPQAVTAEELIAACGGALPPAPDPSGLPPALEEQPQARPAPLTPRRRLGAALSGGAALILFLRFMRDTDLGALVGQEGMTPLSRAQFLRYGCLVAALLVFAGCVTRRRSNQAPAIRRGSRPLSRRTWAAVFLTLLLVPLTLLAGEFYLSGRKYYFIALLVLLECMAPFFLAFEGRKPQARELVVIAVLCAVALAGRAAFFMLPQFKPVMAVTIIAGVALGGEAGFLVGAMTMLTSNVLFSQGPWTPWQMFAMGISGFLAGVLFQKGLLRPSRVSLCVFGALCAILVYGGIMNPASALVWSGTLNWKILLAYWLTGLPFDCVHGAATWLFLWFAGEPLLEKLERVKVKYGLLE